MINRYNSEDDNLHECAAVLTFYYENDPEFLEKTDAFLNHSRKNNFVIFVLVVKENLNKKQSSLCGMILATNSTIYSMLFLKDAKMTKKEKLKKIKELLRDDYSDSKCWKNGDEIERILWILTMFESKCEECELWLNFILEKPTHV